MKTVKNDVIRIIIETSGGIVTSVYSSAAAQVSVLDWDTEECGSFQSEDELEEEKQLNRELEREALTLNVVY